MFRWITVAIIVALLSACASTRTGTDYSAADAAYLYGYYAGEPQRPSLMD